jgi:hypothetical protein
MRQLFLVTVSLFSCWLQLTVWAMGMLSNCTNSTCTLADLNRRMYTNLTSSNNATARLMTGYPSNPGGGNGHLVGWILRGGMPLHQGAWVSLA